MWILANFLNTDGRGRPRRGYGCYQDLRRGALEWEPPIPSFPTRSRPARIWWPQLPRCGDVLIKNVIPKHLGIHHREVGGDGRRGRPNMTILSACAGIGPLNKCNIKTMPHPGFPTDMQPQMAVLARDSQRDQHHQRKRMGQPLPLC